MASFTPNLSLLLPTPLDPSTSNAWGGQLNAGDFSLIDTAVAGILTLSVAGSSNVILTSNAGAADQSRNRAFVFTGALTGNITVFWPQSLNRFFTVVNNTTGAFAITLAVNNGGGSPAGNTQSIPQGNAQDFYSDGTNINTFSYLTSVQSAQFYTGGTTAGTANAQTVAATTPSGYALTVNNTLVVYSSLANTGPMTLNVASTGDINVLKRTAGGLVFLAPGDWPTNAAVMVQYDGTQYELLTPIDPSGAIASLASATTTDLGSVPNWAITIAGTTTINSFGSSATIAEIKFLTFSGALTLTYNAVSMILPGAANITTAASDTAIVQYLGSGNWQMLAYNGVAFFSNLFGGSQGAILYRNASGWTTLPAAAATGALLKSGGPSANPSWQAKSFRQVYNLSNPTGITSTSGAMAGLGSTVAFTPTATGDVLITLGFSVNNPQNVSNQNNAGLRYGTGTAPANGASLTGTQVATQRFEAPTGGGQLSAFSPMTLTALVPGLVTGTAYWADLGLTPSGGTFEIFNITATIIEIP